MENQENINVADMQKQLQETTYKLEDAMADLLDVNRNNEALRVENLTLIQANNRLRQPWIEMKDRINEINLQWKNFQHSIKDLKGFVDDTMKSFDAAAAVDVMNRSMGEKTPQSTRRQQPQRTPFTPLSLSSANCSTPMAVDLRPNRMLVLTQKGDSPGKLLENGKGRIFCMCFSFVIDVFLCVCETIRIGKSPEKSSALPTVEPANQQTGKYLCA